MRDREKKRLENLWITIYLREDIKFLDRDGARE